MAAALLAVLAAAEAGTLPARDFALRAQMLLRQLGGVPTPPSRQTGFFFDPVYPDFLDEVARQTPREATVAVLAPGYPDLYRVQAVYRLAPRRVVESSQIGEARFVAAYGPDRARFSGTPLPNGTLVRK